MKQKAQSASKLWLCLLAALALSGFASANAEAALPSYSNCVATAGPFTDVACHHEGTPGDWAILPYEFTAPINAFEGHGGKGGVRIETSSMQAIVCHSAQSTGELIGTKEQRSVVLTLVACRMGSQHCTSAGAKKSRIVTDTLSGTLGYLAGKGTSTPTVGIGLRASGGPVAEFMCGSTGVRLQGGLIGVIGGDVNLIAKRATQTFTQSGGVQSLTSFEGGSPGEYDLAAEVNTGSGYEAAGSAGLSLTEQLAIPVASEVEA